MKRWILTFVTVAAIGLIGTATASAQGYGWMGGGYGHGGLDCGYGGYGGGFAPNYSNYDPFSVHRYGIGFGGSGLGVSASFGRPAYYHDTSHLHYHPGGVVRHRNHFHVVPGHYDVHRSGHWHR
jgi:hypothetical protein